MTPAGFERTRRATQSPPFVGQKKAGEFQTMGRHVKSSGVIDPDASLAASVKEPSAASECQQSEVGLINSARSFSI